MATVRSPLPAPLLEAQHRLQAQPDTPLTDLAHAVGWSRSHLQRRFTQAFGLSPAAYAAQQRLDRLKRGLQQGRSVTTAIVDAGYGSPSRVYERSQQRLGMPPGAYARGGRGLTVAWSTVATALGLALVAATERGVCAVLLGESEDALEAQLAAEFPQAQRVRCDRGRHRFLAPRVGEVARALAGERAAVDVALIGSAFEVGVWKALMRVPAGQTRSYAALAAELGRASATRAVASACGRNRLAVLVPCHRIVRGDGRLGGYRWGLPLKERLLAREARPGTAGNASAGAAVTSAGGERG